MNIHLNHQMNMRCEVVDFVCLFIYLEELSGPIIELVKLGKTQ